MTADIDIDVSLPFLYGVCFRLDLRVRILLLLSVAVDLCVVGTATILMTPLMSSSMIEIHPSLPVSLNNFAECI